LGFITNSAFAELITVDLPELRGTYENGGYSPRVDLGFLSDSYEKIWNVSLEIKGIATNGWCYVNNGELIDKCPIFGDLLASIGSKDSPPPGMLNYWSTISALACLGYGDFDEIHPFLDLDYGPIYWNVLLNSDDRYLIIENPKINPVYINLASSPEFVLTNVTLVFNAIPIPEPSGICLLMCGGAILLFRIRRIR
jgi:hypothetical protein